RPARSSRAAIRPSPRGPAFSPPATLPTTSIAKPSPRPGKAVWPQSKRRNSWPRTNISVRRRNEYGCTEQYDGLGQAEGVSRRSGSRLVYACRRTIGPFTIGGIASGFGAGSRTLGVPLPPPCARPDPHRAGRIAVSHRARSVHEARGGAH